MRIGEAHLRGTEQVPQTCQVLHELKNALQHAENTLEGLTFMPVCMLWIF